MKNKIEWRFGLTYAFLGVVLSLGALFLLDARLTLRAQELAEKEKQRPAEIELTAITPLDCASCRGVSDMATLVEKQDVKISQTQEVDQASEEGKKLIESYGIKRLPTLIVRGEIDKENVREFFSQLGTIKEDGALVWELNQPIYFDLEKNQPVGLVTLTYLKDPACEDCYDPTGHKALLVNSFGLVVESENVIETSSVEGRELISRYSLTQAPTVLISASATAYPALTEAWKNVGTVEADGVYVFRKNEALGNVVWKDLSTGVIVRPQTQ